MPWSLAYVPLHCGLYQMDHRENLQLEKQITHKNLCPLFRLLLKMQSTYNRFPKQGKHLEKRWISFGITQTSVIVQIWIHSLWYGSGMKRIKLNWFIDCVILRLVFTDWPFWVHQVQQNYFFQVWCWIMFFKGRNLSPCLKCLGGEELGPQSASQFAILL